MTREEQVRVALDELLPAMTADGGGALIEKIGNDRVTLRLVGTCLFCPSRKKSAKALRAAMMQRVPELMDVDVDFPPLPERTLVTLSAKAGSP